MKAGWVDFKTIKDRVSVEQVLAHYGINWLRRSGDELRGKCPIHPNAEGERTFHVNLAKNLFHCFSCGAKGSGVLELVAALEKVSIRQAALKLQGWFIPGQGSERGSERSRKEKAPGAKAPPPAATKPMLSGSTEPTATTDSAAINPALTFELRNIDHAHPYLRERAISEETARLFGVGYFPGKGSMSGRVVMPIRSAAGELVAYAGRSIDNSEPKYKLPAGFKKAAVLYNLDAALKADRSRGVVLTEGFFDTIRIHDSGFPCVVALMGCSLSPEQEKLLVDNFDHVRVMLDGDEPGRNASAEIAARLMRKMFVRVVDVAEGKQPDILEAGELQRLLQWGQE